MCHHACATITYQASLTLTDGTSHGKAWLQQLAPRIRQLVPAPPLRAGARCFKSITSPPQPPQGGSTSSTAVKGRSDRVLASLRAAPLSPSSLDRCLLLRSGLAMPNMTRTMSVTYLARF